MQTSDVRVDAGAAAQPLSRRRFMRNAGAWCVGVAWLVLHPSSLFAQGTPAPAARTHLSQQAFQALLGQTFTLHAAAGETLRLQLVQVTPYIARIHTAAGDLVSDPALESFSLLFRSARGAALPQDTYTFVHATLGSFSWFIVPIGAAQAAPVYEAVFNMKDEG